MKTSFPKKKSNIRKGIFGNSGFTLIEILVATAISTVILLLIYSAHTSITTAIHRLTGVADFYENINLALKRIDRDISCSYFSRQNRELNFISESNYDSPHDGRLNFVTIDNKELNMIVSLKEPFPKSDVKEVGYYLKADEEISGLNFLMRREENHYDDEPESGGMSDIVLENVIDILFEFKKGNDWTNQWDSREHQRFPRAVRTTLRVKNYNEKDEEFIFISYINLRK